MFRRGRPQTVDRCATAAYALAREKELHDMIMTARALRGAGGASGEQRGLKAHVGGREPYHDTSNPVPQSGSAVTRPPVASDTRHGSLAGALDHAVWAGRQALRHSGRVIPRR